MVLSPRYLQTNLVVEAVKKDQEGDASAALSLYCKALEYFVPALHCESPRSWVVVGRDGRGQGMELIWLGAGCAAAPTPDVGPPFAPR